MGAAIPAPGEVLNERYRIVRSVAQGGMGAVLEAVDERLHRRVAIKVVRAELVKDPTARARFDREARSAASVSHPNIVQVYDLGETPSGIAFLVMEWMAGESLAAVLRAEGAIDPARAANLVEQALRGLAVAHATGIVHRDLKPGNLMVSLHGAQEHVKVVDFGIAHLKRGDEYTRLTMTGEIIGTPAFMPPEQLEGKPISPAVDIYAMGVVLWCLLVGKAPFGTGPDVIVRVLTTTPPRADRALASVPRPLADIAERAMQKDPTARFASALEMADALAAAVRGAPLPVSRPSLPGAPLDAATVQARPQLAASQPPTTVQARPAAMQSGTAFGYPSVPPGQPFATGSAPPSLHGGVTGPAAFPAQSAGAGSQRKIVWGLGVAGLLVIGAIVAFVLVARSRRDSELRVACERARQCCNVATSNAAPCELLGRLATPDPSATLALCRRSAETYAAMAASAGRSCDATGAASPPAAAAPTIPLATPGTPSVPMAAGDAGLAVDPDAFAMSVYRCCLRAYQGSSQCDPYRDAATRHVAARMMSRSPGLLERSLDEFKVRAAANGQPCEVEGSASIAATATDGGVDAESAAEPRERCEEWVGSYSDMSRSYSARLHVCTTGRRARGRGTWDTDFGTYVTALAGTWNENETSIRIEDTARIRDNGRNVCLATYQFVSRGRELTGTYRTRPCGPRGQVWTGTIQLRR